MSTRRRTYGGEEDWLDMKGRYFVCFSEEYNDDSFPQYGYGYMEAIVVDIQTDTIYGSYFTSGLQFDCYNSTSEYFYGISVTRDYIDDIVYIHSSGSYSRYESIKFQNGVFTSSDYDGCTYGGLQFKLSEDSTYKITTSNGDSITYNESGSGNEADTFKVVGNTVTLWNNISSLYVATVDLDSMTVIREYKSVMTSYSSRGPTYHFV